MKVLLLLKVSLNGFYLESISEINTIATHQKIIDHRAGSERN